MKQTVSKVVAVALALLLVMGMSSIASAAQVLYVNQAVNVRTGPGTSYVTLGWLNKGDTVQATGNVFDGWTQIQYSTYEIGYINSNYLSSTATSGSGNSYYYYAPVNGNVTPRISESLGSIYKTTSKLNIRSGPSTAYSVIGKLSKGQQVTRIGQEGVWFKILTNEGVNAYVSSRYLKAVTVVNTPIYSYDPTRPNNSSTAGSTATLYSTATLRVRSGPGTNYSIIGGLKRGEAVTYRGTIGSWYQITTSSGLTGYSHSKYLTGSVPVVLYNTPVFSTYTESTATILFGTAITTAKITVAIEDRVAKPTVYASNTTLTIPSGTSVSIYGISGTPENYTCSIRYTDADKSTWIATNVPRASLGK